MQSSPSRRTLALSVWTVLFVFLLHSHAEVIKFSPRKESLSETVSVIDLRRTDISYFQIAEPTFYRTDISKNFVSYQHQQLPLNVNTTSIAAYPFSFNNNTRCDKIDASFLNCSLNSTCIMGKVYTTTCTLDTEKLALHHKTCKLPSQFDTMETFNVTRSYSCNYCWQLPKENYKCQTLLNCQSGITRYKAKCIVRPEVICLGSREFYKNQVCNVASGKSWFKTMILSIFLGGVGVDRFYLNHLGWAFFKLLSFGGFGVWTLIDLVLITLGFLGPADGGMFS